MTAEGMVAKPTDWSDRSYYLSMRDGVRLAVSLYFPGCTEPREPASVLLIQTRYGRAGVRRKGQPRGLDPWLRAGFVAMVVDVRGSTSSFGARTAELGPEEQADMDEIIAHAASQPWSNGKVIATGVSYTANTADMATTRPAPALIAAIPRQTDFDFWELFWPGGIFNRAMFHDWMSGIREIDFGRPRTRTGALVNPDEAGLDARERIEDVRKLFPTLQPVDEDPDGALLNQALRAREQLAAHWTIEDYAAIEFRDDIAHNGSSFFEGCCGSKMDAVRREKKPVQYWGSWIDCNTAEAALSRFNSAADVPAEIIITANTHGGDARADPLLPDVEEPMPSLKEQERQTVVYADQVLHGRYPLTLLRKANRRIRYYVLGAGVMKEASRFSSAGSRFHLDENGRLYGGAPMPGTDVYEVDPTATTGRTNRWHWIARPSYPDRREEDRKLLTYDSAPFSEDFELAGWPVMTLRMRTRTSDPVVFAYLENVAPDGRVTYLTEGQLRAINRRIADPKALPYDPGPAPHSFRRADALPVIPGEAFTLKLKLFATAALIRVGHRLRLAIAGADADTFAPTSDRPERFEIIRGGAEPSMIELPLTRWRTD
ncbi:MAG: CocE/NonD family hydrolase [Alphaproteobacteria bacterium]|nr:CocE/NonD family hydrolase [Alphaproteobacteria bacterium]